MGGMTKVGVLVSGRGSNMAALVDACAAPGFPAEVAVVVSDVPDAGGLAIARSRGIAAVAVDRATFPSRAAFEAALADTLRSAGVEIVCLAGFMRVLGAGFLEGWPGRVLNVHPSLLPAFRGLDTHARTLTAGVRIAGCTVHVVTPALDDGPILIQAAVPVLPDDTPSSLAARILVEEHRCYPAALRWMAEGRVSIDSGRAIVSGVTVPESAMAVPATE